MKEPRHLNSVFERSFPTIRCVHGARCFRIEGEEVVHKACEPFPKIPFLTRYSRVGTLEGGSVVQVTYFGCSFRDDSQGSDSWHDADKLMLLKWAKLFKRRASLFEDS